ncbi:MAG: hypothetical protein ABI210_06420 [Abditibacteriaceae bacterium]
MNAEDRVIGLHVRHAFAKSPLDLGELIVTCRDGTIELDGKVKRPRDHVDSKTMNLNRELETLKQLARNVHGVKGLYADRVRIID